MRATDLLLEPVKKYRTSINPPYKRKDLISILGTLFILLALPLTVFVATQVRPWGPRAAGTAAAPTTIGSVIEPGSMVSGANYIVFIDGSNYYAKDGKTGEIKFSGTGDATPVIQAAIDALPSGGRVVLMEGNFNISSTILIRNDDNHVTLEGQGWATVIVQKANVSGIKVGNSSAEVAGVVIRNLELYGDKLTYTTTTNDGIDLDRTNNPLISNVRLQNWAGDGIAFGQNSTNNSWSIRVRDCVIYGSGNDNIHLDYVEAGEIQGCHMNTPGQDDIELSSNTGYLVISHNNIDSATRHGIYILDGAHNTVSDNVINLCGQNCIATSGGDTLITDNHIADASWNSDNNYSCVYVWGNFVWPILIQNNIIWRSEVEAGKWEFKYGIEVNASIATAVMISGNQVRDGKTGQIYDGSGKAVIKDNLGYVTENSGTATITSGSSSVTVNHGLAVTPSAGDIMVTPTSPLGVASKFYVANYTSNQFTIYLDQNPGVNVTFAWRAEVK